MHLLYLTANQKIFLLLLTYVHVCVCACARVQVPSESEVSNLWSCSDCGLVDAASQTVLWESSAHSLLLNLSPPHRRLLHLVGVPTQIF